jgi:alpha-methylacyl-CoA racemase
LYLAIGLLSAFIHARSSGRGQVVDAAMIDGAASLMTMFFGLHAAGLHRDNRGSNVLDSGAPYYDVYECKDGGYLAVAAIEIKFRRELLERLGLAGLVPDGEDKETWPDLREALSKAFLSKGRDEWMRVFNGSDACVSPVLSMAEAPNHPHNVDRGLFEEVDGVVQPVPAPRFSGTPLARPRAPEPLDSDLVGALRPWGFEDREVETLLGSGIAGLTKSRSRKS